MGKVARLGCGVLFPYLIYMTVNIGVTFLWSNQNPLLSTMISAGITSMILVGFFQKDQLQRGIFPIITRIKAHLHYLPILGFSSCIVGNYMITISGLVQRFPGFAKTTNVIVESPFYLQFAAAGIVIPIAEELVFRALGFRRLRDELGFWSSAIYSSVFFGISHQNVVQGMYAFFLGMILAYGYERYQSIQAPIILHISMNLTSLGMTYIQNEALMYILIPMSCFLVFVYSILIYKHVDYVGDTNIFDKSTYKEEL